MQRAMTPARTQEKPDQIVRWAVIIFLLLLTFDGAIRKWLLPGLQTIVFITKDVLLLIVVTGLVANFGQARNNFSVPISVQFAFGAYAAWVILECFNPHLPNLAVAAWGAKSHLLYAGLILVIPAAFKDLRDVFQSLAKIFPWLTIPVCLVAFVQVVSPADSFINEQVGGNMESIAYFGDASLVRVTGTFSYISGMSTFTVVSTLFGLALLIFGLQSPLFLIGLALTVMSLPASGSRSVILTCAIGFVGLLAASSAVRLVSIRSAGKIVAVCAASLAISIVTQDQVWQAMHERFLLDQTGDETSSRTLAVVATAFRSFEHAGLLGFGTGAANFGSLGLIGSLEPFSWLPRDFYFEEEAGRIVLELGMTGYVLSSVLRLSLLVWSIRLATTGLSPLQRMAGILALPHMALGAYNGTGVFAASYMPVSYWFLVAVMAMADHEQKAQYGTQPNRTASQKALGSVIGVPQ
jgi:O-Antigen ligase